MMARWSRLIAAVMLSAACAPAHAAEFSIGPVVSYAWWRPFEEAYLRGRGEDRVRTGASSFTMRDSAFLYGPAFRAGLSDRWHLDGSFIFSVQRGYHARGRYAFIAPGLAGAARTSSRQIDRYATEIAAGYRLGDIFSITAGARSQVYSHSGHIGMVLGTGALTVPMMPSTRTLSWNAGVTLGAAMDLPLTGDLRLAAAVAAMALPGRHETRGPSRSIDPFVAVGGAADLSLAYIVTGIGARISIGGRYQVMRHLLLPGADARRGRLSGPLDQGYGVVASAMFGL